MPVGTDCSEMTLGDIVPNDKFISSSIQFLTSGGATAKVTVDGLGTVYATYIYWTKDDEPVGGAGWYLYDDDTATYNQNSRVIPFGDAYCVDRDGEEPEAALTFAGEVQTTAVTKQLNSKFNYVGNCSPVDLTLGDITPNDKFISSSIQFLTSGGATAKVTIDGLGTVYATYIYWTKDDEPVGGAGWYLYDDDTATYNQNSRVIAAGEAFCVDRDGEEPEATITIPAAL